MLNMTYKLAKLTKWKLEINNARYSPVSHPAIMNSNRAPVLSAIAFEIVNNLSNIDLGAIFRLREK